MSSSKIVLDSYALIAYFEDEPGAEKVEQILNQAETGKLKLLMSIINWGEVYYTIHRSKGEKAAEDSKLIIDQLPITIMDVDRALAYQAAKLKSRHAVAFGDCFAAALATINKARVLTGDLQFKELEKEIAIEWIK